MGLETKYLYTFLFILIASMVYYTPIETKNTIDSINTQCVESGGIPERVENGVVIIYKCLIER